MRSATPVRRPPRFRRSTRRQQPTRSFGPGRSAPGTAL